MPDASTSFALRAGAVSALVAAAIGLIVSIVLVAVAGTSGVGPTWRTGVRSWLVAQGSGLTTGGASIAPVPWGGVLVVALLAFVVAGRVARRSAGPADTPTVLELPAFAASAAGSAGVLAGALSALSSTSDTSTSIVRSAFAAFVVTGVASAVGAARATGQTESLWPTGRADVRTAVRAGFRGACGLVGAGAVVTATLLGVHSGRAIDLWGLLDPGLGGGLALGLLCLALVPTAALWSVAVMLGPGFVLGTDTSVDLTGAQLGPVPGLPLLAALPSPGAFGDVVVVLGLLPVLAGAWAGWSAVSRAVAPDDDAPDLIRDVAVGAGAGAVAGALVGFLVGASGGPVGPGRLADAGPPALTSFVLAVLVLAVGGAVGGALSHYRGRRAADPSHDETVERARADRGPGLGQRDQPAGPAGRDAGALLRRLRRRGRE